LKNNDIPFDILLSEAMRVTDKAQFELRKYRNNSRQVAIDPGDDMD